MKKYLITFLTISTFLITSCASNKLSSSSVKPADIHEVAYFEPLSFISLIEKGNRAIPSDSLSNVAKISLDSVIQKSSAFRISGNFNLSDNYTSNQVKKEIVYLVQLIIKSKKINGIKIPLAIDSIMKSNQQRFALATVVTGFGRKAGNFGGQVAKGIGVGILTLGMYAPVPVKSSNTLYGIILDSERGEIIYYGKATPVEKSPTDQKVMEQQYRKLFQGYFYQK